jgi:hypothetical protein
MDYKSAYETAEAELAKTKTESERLDAVIKEMAADLTKAVEEYNAAVVKS